MRIAVCVKEVLDARLPIMVRPPAGEIVQMGTGPVSLINPADRTALEVSLNLRDEQAGGRVEVFSVCEAGQQGALYFALARGADSVERLEPVPGHSGPPWTALLLARRLGGQGYDLIFCGDETLDNSSAMVGPLVAELLGLPQVTGIVKLLKNEGKQCSVERGLERGHRELVEVSLPALLTFKAEAAEPRYVAMRWLEEARRTEIPARCLDTNGHPGNLPRWPESEKRLPPRARVKQKFAPDANLPAAERVKMIMSGGMAPQASSQSSNVLEGDPDYLSEQLFRFLKHHELI
jgi:electron transfer flavoprotein beta subunit